MPKTSRLPRYRKHRASGQAIVTLCGRDFYLGRHGTKVSLQEYDRMIAEWLAGGRRLPQYDDQPTLTLVELGSAYLRHARQYYRKNGRETYEVHSVKSALKVASEMYGREPAAEFGPLRLQAVQQRMIDLGWGRNHINKQVSRIVRAYKWAASKELVSATAYEALKTVSGLRKGRTAATESTPVQPVTEEDIQSTLPHLPPTVADMVRLQRLTGCRPGELVLMRPCDIDRDGDVWLYVPEEHKTEHHGRPRVIAIGPRGQDILRPYLLRGADEYCFSPRESERRRRDEATANRRTPLSCGNRVGTNKRKRPQRPAGERYTNDSYRRCVHRACDTAGIKRWSPNRLRHSAATEIRRKFGLEAAQVSLGHASADITQVYAERDLSLATSVARQLG